MGEPQDVVQGFMVELIQNLDQDEGWSERDVEDWLGRVRASGEEITEKVRLRAAILLRRLGRVSEEK